WQGGWGRCGGPTARRFGGVALTVPGWSSPWSGVCDSGGRLCRQRLPGPPHPATSLEGLLDILLFEEFQKLPRPLQLRKPVRHVGFFGELGDFSENGQVLIRHLERRRHDQEEVMHRLAGDPAEIDALELAP